MTSDQRMLEAFDRFKAQIDEAYDAAREALAAGQFERAQMILAQLAQTHARTSMSLRNYLIKRGRLKAEE
jgi:hypothetical protein